MSSINVYGKLDDDEGLLTDGWLLFVLVEIS